MSDIIFEEKNISENYEHNFDNENRTFSSDFGVEKLKTGIKGFDTLLEGGIPKGRTLTVSGSTGTGKTVLLNEFLYRGITEFNENGVFVTFEERPKDIKKNVSGFGWNYTDLIEQGKLAFVDVSPDPSEKLTEIGEDYNLYPLVERIKNAIDKIGAKRVVIDSLDTLFLKFKNKNAIRTAVYGISDQLKLKNVTSMISSEKNYERMQLSRYGMQEYVSDGVLELELKSGEQQLIRQMHVRKLRGVGYRSGTVEFDITKNGLEVYPKIPINFDIAKTDFNNRFSFGINRLDEFTDGGVPEGHIILVSGNTGTGKTLLGMQYLKKGIDLGENTVYVALEEPVVQLKKTALEHGWDFEEYEQNNKLSFVGVDTLIDVNSDKLLYDIINTVEKNNAKRIVIDSISSLESATTDKEKIRQFMLQLGGYFKTKGITCLMNYLNPSLNFTQESTQEGLGSMQTNAMRLSSITDGVILMRYVEDNNQIQKYMNILKLRGSSHNKEIFKYDIEKGGIRIQ